MSLLTRVLNFVSKINLGSFSSLKINEDLRFDFLDNGLRSCNILCEKILVAIIIINKPNPIDEKINLVESTQKIIQ
jgi:hypothetical protein